MKRLSLAKTAHEHVARLAAAKAELVAARAVGPAIVIARGYGVTLEDRILGKPRSEEDARHMLEILSGRTHTVLTGVQIIRLPDAQRVSFVESTLVHFDQLPREEISRYLATAEPHDKAGATPFKGVPGATFRASKDAISMWLVFRWRACNRH